MTIFAVNLTGSGMKFQQVKRLGRYSSSFACKLRACGAVIGKHIDRSARTRESLTFLAIIAPGGNEPRVLNNFTLLESGKSGAKDKIGYLHHLEIQLLTECVLDFPQNR